MTFKGLFVQSSGYCFRLTPDYQWTLKAAPAGAGPWSATGEQVTFTPKVTGEYTLELDLVVTNGGQSGNLNGVIASAEKKLTAAAGGAQPQSGTGVQEFAMILAPSGSALHAFPATLKVPAGSLPFFLTSLDRTVTIVLRRDGAQGGVATVLVEAGKVATVEAELPSGSYGLFDQGSNAPLGQIVAQ